LNREILANNLQRNRERTLEQNKLLEKTEPVLAPQGSIETQEDYADEDFAPDAVQVVKQQTEESTKPPIKRLTKKPAKLP
jgi:hypothetical protein